MKKALLAIPFLALAAGSAHAAPATFNIESSHTYPSFEADHMGLSTWRGKFSKTEGTVTLDREAAAGTVDIKVDIGSVDFGMDKMNEHALKADILDAAKYPTATYKGKLAKFVNGAPTQVDGELTLHGVTRPLTLKILKFNCIPQHPFFKREACGADAYGSFQRDDFGITAGKDWKFDMTTVLRIQVEAVKAE